MPDSWSHCPNPLSCCHCKRVSRIMVIVYKSKPLNMLFRKPLSFHAVSFGPHNSTLRRMAQIALEIQKAAPRDPLLPASEKIESSYSEALDSVCDRYRIHLPSTDIKAYLGSIGWNVLRPGGIPEETSGIIINLNGGNEWSFVLFTCNINASRWLMGIDWTTSNCTFMSMTNAAYCPSFKCLKCLIRSMCPRVSP